MFQPTWIWLVPRLAGVVSDEPVPASGTVPDPDIAMAGPSSTILDKPVPASGTIPDSDITMTGPTPTAAEKSQVANSMRTHWAKCQAQVVQFEEEVALTVEEMGQTLLYFEWKKSWWLSMQPNREQSAAPLQLVFATGCMHMRVVKPTCTQC